MSLAKIGEQGLDSLVSEGLALSDDLRQVEAACKHVVGARMKRCGMRWSAAGSQSTLSLRVARLNRQWDTFWKRHPLARAA